MELRDTVEMMNSSDYKERFKAEYDQLNIRRNKLIDMLSDWDTGRLGFTPSCSFELLSAQLGAMNTYMFLLRERARIENINLV